MTYIEEKALALVKTVLTERNLSDKRAVRREVSPYTEALCRALEQHEAYKQKVSDAAEEVVQRQGKLQALLPFIIPKPKPDPLVRIINEVIYAQPDGDINEATMAKGIRAALDARGLEIREKGQ